MRTPPTPTPTPTLRGAGIAEGEPAGQGARSLGVTFAFDSYGGGQSQLGPELTFRARLGTRLLVVLGAAGRQGLTFAAPSGSVTSRLLGGRLALGLDLLPAARRVALACDAGVRGAGLWFEGHPTSGAVTAGHRVSTFVAYADALCALDVIVTRGAALRASAGGGVPLVAQTAVDRAGAETGASGRLVEAQAGVVLLF